MWTLREFLFIIFSFAVLSSLFTFLYSLRDSVNLSLIERINDLEAALKQYQEKEFAAITSLPSQISRTCEKRTELLKDWTNETSWLPRNRNDARFFRSKDKVLILLWTSAGWTDFGAKGVWKTPNYLGDNVPLKDCGLPCEFTSDKSLLPYADGVLFQVQPLAGYGNDHVAKPPEFPQKRFNQFFINMGYEQPHYFHLYGHAGYLIHNEIKMTYDQDSQVPITMHCNWGGEGGLLEDLLRPPPPKTKLIAWFGTNCHGSGGHSLRATWMREFMKYIDVDSYGKCLNTIDLPKEMQFPIYSNHGASMNNKVKLFREYKFGLALENNNVTDYVTEKVFNVLQGGAIPVYMGSKNIKEWVPENSVIDVNDFPSLRHVAEHILRVSRNDTLFQEYFQWKTKPFPKAFLEKYDNCVYRGANCRLCQKIEEMRSTLKKDRSTLEGPANPEAIPFFHSSFALKVPEGTGWVEFPKHPKFNLKTNYTLAGWIHPTVSTPMRIIDKGSDGVIDGYSLDLIPVSEELLSLRFCAAQICARSSNPVPMGKWTWVGVVVVPGKATLYVNFLKDSEHLLNAFTSANDFPLFFGRVAKAKGHLYPFYGYFDDFSLWDRPLSKWEMRKLSFTLPRGDEDGLIGFWPFNEGSGEVVTDCGLDAINGKISGKVDWMYSPSKPLVLPNAKPMKANWNLETEAFFDPEIL